MTTEGDMTSSSSEDDEQLSDSESDSESGYDTESDNKDNASEEEDEEEDNTAQEEARHQRVRTDMDEMQRMIIDMEKVKMRLQFRFAAERQSKLERLAREEQERETDDQREVEAIQCLLFDHMGQHSRRYGR
ncbi:hypothetical protein BBO99_00008110 [Phytophthora kernoviae]|uniref:Uncharacterized protein n=2 Tax=Phytophthora kernoviae TaxID=325452 RepID=A0A3R7J3T0_9STRA|nr:hypothetical protein G195_009306 [Phytophthora kernoviae 00238/432]KAG2515096.1 hypothetical protein JM16_007779 [Phytophthora kernoviae]RLN46595.1 hypothetical protein BBI17_008050 [Phytophthora kernoviae]RLN75729.1 hypothetical protein BBO99_00008110 [Phytophthora kernoviae]